MFVLQIDRNQMKPCGRFHSDGQMRFRGQIDLFRQMTATVKCSSNGHCCGHCCGQIDSRGQIDFEAKCVLQSANWFYLLRNDSETTTRLKVILRSFCILFFGEINLTSRTHLTATVELPTGPFETFIWFPAALCIFSSTVSVRAFQKAGTGQLGFSGRFGQVL